MRKTYTSVRWSGDTTLATFDQVFKGDSVWLARPGHVKDLIFDVLTCSSWQEDTPEDLQESLDVPCELRCDTSSGSAVKHESGYWFP